MSKHISIKNYVELDVVRIIDRNTTEGESAWMTATDHHLFQGNHTMMIFERFWSDGCSLEQLNENSIEYPDEYNAFTYFITKFLEENGYRYKDYILYSADGIKYDGTLLKFSW